MTRRNKYQVSRHKMYLLGVKLKNRLKTTPEEEVQVRETLTHKIELINVIRGEMKILIEQLK